MTIRERIKEFIKYLNISEREFCRSIGVSPAYVQAVRNKINTATREAMEAAYPLLNTEWVLTGRGSMLLDAPKPPKAPEAPVIPEKKKEVAGADAGMSERLLALVESQQQTIAQLTESNNRLARLLEGYKKVTTPAEAVGALSSAVLP